MIKRATSRARKQQVPVAFQVAFAQRLPFPNATFDAVACTLALHHVAEDDQQSAVQEMHRVLKPEGRLLIAEFDQGHGPHALLRWLRPSAPEHMAERARQLVDAAGFTAVTSRPTNLSWLRTITARKGACVPEPVDLCPEPVGLCPEPVEGRYGGSRCSARGGGSDIASAASSMSWSVPVMRPSCWRTCSCHEGTLNSSTNLLG